MVITDKKLARKIRGVAAVMMNRGNFFTKKDNFDNTEIKGGDNLYIGTIVIGIAMNVPEKDGTVQVWVP